MKSKLLFTAVVSGSLGFLMGAMLLTQKPGHPDGVDAVAFSTKPAATVKSAPEKPTALLRRHERQSPEASSEAEAIITSILRRREAKLDEIRKQTRGFPTREDSDAIAAVTKEAESELKNRLSAEDYNAYKRKLYLQTDVARNIKESLSATDAELTAIAEYKRVQSELNPNADNDLKYQEMKNELSAKVGEERASLFLSMHDPEYREIYAFTRRFGLEPSIANDITQLKNELRLELDKARKELRASRESLDEYEIKTRQIREQTHKHFHDLVGEDAAEIFIRDAEQATWLR